MAISQFFFGQTIFAIRLPDVIMHAILTFFIFDMGRIIKNPRTGFMAALFFTFLVFPLNLISGIAMLDHNDFAFMFYVTASFWAYFNYQQKQKTTWAVLVGLFVGCAILVKWLPGMLVYLGWFFVYVYQNKNIKNPWLPWQCPAEVTKCPSLARRPEQTDLPKTLSRVSWRRDYDWFKRGQVGEN